MATFHQERSIFRKDRAMGKPRKGDVRLSEAAAIQAIDSAFKDLIDTINSHWMSGQIGVQVHKTAQDQLVLARSAVDEFVDNRNSHMLASKNLDECLKRVKSLLFTVEKYPRRSIPCFPDDQFWAEFRNAIWSKSWTGYRYYVERLQASRPNGPEDQLRMLDYYVRVITADTWKTYKEDSGYTEAKQQVHQHLVRVCDGETGALKELVNNMYGLIMLHHNLATLGVHFGKPPIPYNRSPNYVPMSRYLRDGLARFSPTIPTIWKRK